MATFQENRVDIGITLTRDAAGNHVILSARTLDRDSGLQMRRVRQDVTDKMSPERLAGIDALLNDAVTYCKQQLALPADVQVGPDEAL